MQALQRRRQRLVAALGYVDQRLAGRTPRSLDPMHR